MKKEETEKKEIISKMCKYSFTEDEITKLGRELAQKNKENENTENEKKSVMSNYKAKLDALAAEIAMVSGNIQNGFEFKYMDVEVVYDYKKGIKTFRRVDNQENVGEEKLSPGEYQTTILDNP